MQLYTIDDTKRTSLRTKSVDIRCNNKHNKHGEFVQRPGIIMVSASAQRTNWDHNKSSTRNGKKKKRKKNSMQIFFVERMHLLRKVRPTQRPRQLIPQPPLILPRPLPRKLDLPPTQIIQQPHIRLDQHRQPARPHNQVRIHKRQPKVLHHIRDLPPSQNPSTQLPNIQKNQKHHSQ